MQARDEIRSLTTRINSLKYQLKQTEDFKLENDSIKNGLSQIKQEIKKINEESQKIQRNISPVLSNFKQLISNNHKKYSNLNASYNNDLLERMEKDNKLFEEKIYLMEKKSEELINNLYEKVNKYLASNQQGENNFFDIGTIKYNLFNILNEFNQIFEEIKNILELSNKSVSDEEEETLRNIEVIEIIIKEVDRIMEYVPLNQIIRNNILSQLGINSYNYPLNTPTLKIILTNIQEVKRKRQTQLRAILDQIKEKSNKILEKQAQIKNQILSAINIIKNGGQNNKKDSPIVTLEDLFTSAKEKGQNNIREFQNDVCGNLDKEIKAFKEKLEKEKKEAEDLLAKAKQEFINKWAQIKSQCCSSIIEHANNSLKYFFFPKIDSYKKYESITSFLKEKIYLPECNIINFGLINCNDSIKKIKEDVVPIKCIIPIGNNNNGYKESLDELLIKESSYLYYKNDKELSDIYYDIAYSIKKITGYNNMDILFPVILVHYNNYAEFEKDLYKIEKFVINCLKIKIGFLFFFGKEESKDIKSINKKINEFINKTQTIKEILQENKNFELSPDLGYNLDMIKDGVIIEMEKLTNYKKDKKNKINEQSKKELITEYFNKMWDVFNTHSIKIDLDLLKNSKDEEECRNRLAGSIMDYSILCLNLDKKPNVKLIKERDQTLIFQGIKQILDNVFENNLYKDFEIFMEDLIKKKIFELYLSRENLMAEIDLKYNTSILTEEFDENKIKKQIREEITNLVDKSTKKDVLKLVGRFVWERIFDDYCKEFYKLIQNGFNIPDNFEEYLIEYLNIK